MLFCNFSEQESSSDNEYSNTSDESSLTEDSSSSHDEHIKLRCSLQNMVFCSNAIFFRWSAFYHGNKSRPVLNGTIQCIPTRLMKYHKPYLMIPQMIQKFVIVLLPILSITAHC